LAVPRAKVVRGFSNFGVSFVYIVLRRAPIFIGRAAACSNI